MIKQWVKPFIYLNRLLFLFGLLIVFYILHYKTFQLVYIQIYVHVYIPFLLEYGVWDIWFQLINMHMVEEYMQVRCVGSDTDYYIFTIVINNNYNNKFLNSLATLN